MKSLVYLAAATSAFVSLVSTQDTTNTTSVTVAAETVSASVSAAPTLFVGEAVQLTDAVLDNVTATINNDSISSLFTFSSNDTLARRTTHSCKLMPGDRLWPIKLVWDIFDLLLGGALIKASPLAAVCYPSWPQYNAAKCAAVTADWLISDLQ